MRPQPDMARQPLAFEPMTWRDHVRTALELVAAIMGGFGIFAIIACMQEIFR